MIRFIKAGQKRGVGLNQLDRSGVEPGRSES